MLKSESNSELYLSGRSAFENYSDWDKKYHELLEIEINFKFEKTDGNTSEYIDFYGHPTPNYTEAKSVAGNRSISPIAVHNLVVTNRENLIELLKDETDGAKVSDLSRAVAHYDIYLLSNGAPFVMNTELKFSVPSGRIVVTDSFSDYFVPEGNNEGESAFMHNLAVRHMAEYEIATARVDYFPVMLKQEDDSFLFASLGDDEIVHATETKIAYSKTGTYDGSVELMDYDNWLSRTGRNLENSNNFSLVDVVPGVYHWVVYSHNQRFYERFYEDNVDVSGREVYAELKLVQAY